RNSYSIYLTHAVYLTAFHKIVGEIGEKLGVPSSIQLNDANILVLGGPWIMDVASIVCVVGVVVGSSYTYRYVEEPARLFFNRLSEGDGYHAALSAALQRLQSQ